MGNDDAKQLLPPPRHHSRRRSRSRRGSSAAHCHHFPEGSLVEVENNEKDCEGVYFSATVVAPPISPRNKSPNTKNLDGLYVQYHNLLASEDGREPLREYVKVSSVRPLPPSHEVTDVFQPNDVVDAFHMDGWWTGVVSRVVEGGERFVVIFASPPDEIEFGLSGLRAHWDWVDGVWVMSQRRNFVVGMKVEVWYEIERDDGFRGAWYPATIVQDLRNGSFMVEFQVSDGGSLKFEVHYVHVRPRPPIIKGWEFGASEKVDAFHNYGWWSGLIRQNKDGYVVFLEQMRSEFVFYGSDLRPRMDWKAGKWSIGFDSHKTSATRTKRKRPQSSVSSSVGAPKKHANQEIEKVAVEAMLNEDSDTLLAIIVVDKESNTISPRLEKSPDEAIEQQSWPFTKRSALWEVLESKDVFNKMPQKPHFKPLAECNESEREGMAIGCMVTFSNIVERIGSLNMNVSKGVVDDINETLLHLETQGFEVEMVRQRLTQLKAAQDAEEKLLQKVKDVRVRISECEVRKSSIEAEIGEMKGHVRKLQEKMVVSEIARAEADDEIAHLKAGLRETEQRLENVRSGFKVVL